MKPPVLARTGAPGNPTLVVFPARALAARKRQSMSSLGLRAGLGAMFFAVGISPSAFAEPPSNEPVAPPGGTTVASTGPTPPEAMSPAARSFAAEPAPSRDEPRRVPLDARPQPHRVGLFISPGALLFGMFPFEVDIRVAKPVTINLQALVVNSGDITGYGVAAGPQLFFGGHAFRGGYLSPALVYVSLSGAGAEATAVGGGATLGYQWLIGNFGARLGGGAMYYSASAHGAAKSTHLSGASPAVDAAIGLSF